MPRWGLTRAITRPVYGSMATTAPGRALQAAAAGLADLEIARGGGRGHDDRRARTGAAFVRGPRGGAAGRDARRVGDGSSARRRQQGQADQDRHAETRHGGR